MASQGVENMIGFGSAALLHEDGRYFRRGEGGNLRAPGTLGSADFVTRRMAAAERFSVWRFGATTARSSCRTRGVRRAKEESATRCSGARVSVGFDVAANVFKEFWPDMKRRVFKKLRVTWDAAD